MSSFKRSENIQKKESGSDCTVSNSKFSFVTLNELATKARERNFEFQQDSQSKDRYKSKWGPNNETLFRIVNTWV